MNLSEQLMELHKPKSLNEKLGFKTISKLLKKFKGFKKIKKSKDAFDAKLAKKKQGKSFWKKFFEDLNEEFTDEKRKVLAKYLHANDVIDEIEDLDDENIEDYEILTDKEANEQLKEYIEQSVWAFNADFLQSHWGTQEDINKSLGLESSYYDEDTEEDVEMDDADEVFYINMGMSLEEWIADKQNNAEDSNDDFMKLIQDFDEFVSDAEKSDGRGHFLSSYDGEENEVDGYYIYRTN